MQKILRSLLVASLFTLCSPSAHAERLVFVENPSAEVPAGKPFDRQPMVALVDDSGNRIDWDNSCVITLSLVGGDEGDLLAGNSLSRIMVNGVADFSSADLRVLRSFTHQMPLSYRLMASPAGTCAPLREEGQFLSEPFTVTLQGIPSQLSILQAPSDSALNETWATQPIVAVLDGDGNLVNNDNTTWVVMRVEEGSPAGILIGSTSVQVINGLASFSGLKISSGESESTGRYRYSFTGLNHGLRLEVVSGVEQNISARRFFSPGI